MSDAGQKSVLARKADLVRSRGPRKSQSMDFGVMPQKGLNRAIKRAGVPFKTLEPEPRNETVIWDQSLADVTSLLPEGGLLVVLEGEERVRGLLYLEQSVLDALIEVQTTGHVDTVAGTNRPATQIDAALSRDFIDLLLSALDNEFNDMNMDNIVMRMRFGAIIPDRKQLPLLVPERGFHLFQAKVSMGGDAKIGEILLALPGMQTAAASWPKRGPDPVWRDAFHHTIGQAKLQFGTVLFRRQISLKSALALQPGTVIPFDPEMLGAVRVEDANGRAILKGRLGQSGGNRALRLTLGAVERADEPAEAGFGSTARDPDPGGTGRITDPPPLGQGSESGGLDDLAGGGFALPEADGPDIGGLPGLDEPGGLPPLDGDLPPLDGSGLPPLDGGGLPPLDGDAGLPPLGGDGGLPPLGGDGGLPPLGGDGGLPPLDSDGGLPPLGAGGLPPLGEGGLPPLDEDGGLPPLGEGGLPPLGDLGPPK